MQKMSVVIAGRIYLKEFYLQKARSTNNFFKKLTLLSNEVFITPDEMFELLLEVSDDLSTSNEIYLKS